jgi:hypothetical protein
VSTKARRHIADICRVESIVNMNGGFRLPVTAVVDKTQVYIPQML